MNDFEIVFDNGGGATLQSTDGSFVHSYSDMAQLAEDVKHLVNGATTEAWDGHEPECYISDDEFNANLSGYRLLDSDDLASDDLASDDLASDELEEKCTRHGWANMRGFFEAYSAK